MPSGKVFADVKWWDEWLVTISCPVCNRLHTHGFGAGYDTTSRTAHCAHHQETPRLTYNFRYPFSQNSGATEYEIDKPNKRYVALGADPPARAEKDALVNDLAQLDVKETSTASNPESDVSWAEATEDITIDLTDDYFRKLHAAFGGETTFEIKRLDHVMSRMILYGDTMYLRSFLDSSSDAEIFLHGRSEDGDTALTMAACEKYSGVVGLLLARGADPNASNRAGRTPLMEASLWGRCGNVRCLLAAGADPTSTDSAGLTARDFTELCKRNVEERYHRSGRGQVYKEDALVANEAREVIKCWLGHDGEEAGPVTTNEDFQHRFFLQASPSQLKLLAPVDKYTLPQSWKTIARLERGGPYTPISAMSGWSHGDDVTLVSGKDWTNDVMKLARAVGYTLKSNPRKDQGSPGRHQASHAEPQLIAYFVSKHCFLPVETRFRQQSIRDVQQDSNDLQRLENIRRIAEERIEGPLCRLASARPPVMMRRATILISKAPCKECAAFQVAVNAALDISIVLQQVPILD